jgi:hypothetical protein
MRPPSEQLAEGAEEAALLERLDKEAAGHDVDLRSELTIREVERAQRVLGKAVHPGAIDRLYELWPEAIVYVQHGENRAPGDRMSGPAIVTRWTRVTIVRSSAKLYEVVGEAFCHPNDRYDRKRGIELAFKRALNDVRWINYDLAAHPGKTLEANR